jgi:hypothetical protein
MSWFGILLPFIVIGLMVGRVVRARQFARQWAKRNGFTIVQRKATWFRMSPFPMASFTKQSVHYLVVRDASGSTRRCWLAIGDVFIGHLDDRVEVVWE